MSMNLFMKGVNPETGNMENVPLYQTPTTITNEILRLGRVDDILESYLLWTKDHQFDTSHIDTRTTNPYEINQIFILNNEFDEYSEKLQNYTNITFFKG